MRYKILSTASKYLGVAEIPGKKANPLIVKWSRQLLTWVMDDETPWCSSFMKHVFSECGIENNATASARSWLKEGVTTNNPKPGDLVILWRESPTSWKGHVGIYMNHDSRYVWILGGNQSNSVNITPYSVHRVLAFKTFENEA